MTYLFGCLYLLVAIFWAVFSAYVCTVVYPKTTLNKLRVMLILHFMLCPISIGMAFYKIFRHGDKMFEVNTEEEVIGV